MNQIVSIILLSAILPCVIFAASLGKSGERRLGVLETIHGIPYPTSNGSIAIVEEMAHADLFLEEPVVAKVATFTIAFDAGNAEAINIGIRDNEFWLSYKKYPLYRKGVDNPGFQRKEIHIPLTTALQDTDRSVDVMLFAEKSVQYRIHAFRARIDFDMPSTAETKAYIKSIVTRERAL